MSESDTSEPSMSSPRLFRTVTAARVRFRRASLSAIVSFGQGCEGEPTLRADAIAGLVGAELSESYIVPSPFDPRVGPSVAAAVAEAARRDRVARR